MVKDVRSGGTLVDEKKRGGGNGRLVDEKKRGGGNGRLVDERGDGMIESASGIFPQ